MCLYLMASPLTAIWNIKCFCKYDELCCSAFYNFFLFFVIYQILNKIWFLRLTTYHVVYILYLYFKINIFDRFSLLKWGYVLFGVLESNMFSETWLTFVSLVPYWEPCHYLINFTSGVGLMFHLQFHKASSEVEYTTLDATQSISRDISWYLGKRLLSIFYLSLTSGVNLMDVTDSQTQRRHTCQT